MKYEFDGEAWDTEERVLSMLRGYTVELTYDLGTGETDTMDVVLGRVVHTDVGGLPVLQYRLWSDEIDGPYGDEQSIEYERLTALKVY